MSSDLISCKEASRRIKTDLENSINKVALKTAQMLNPSIYESNSNVALNKTDSQILDVNNYLLKSSKSSLETIKQAVMMQGFIDGMNNRMSLGNSNNPYAVAKAKLTQRESWKVIGANAPTYLVILKIFIQVMLYALFPIIIVMVMAGIFGFSILIEYFKSLFALCLISPCLAILNRISYGYTSYKMKALISTSASNSADYGINLGNIIQIQDFNADIMAFAGYLSIAIVPLCFSITQRGFNSIGSSIGSLMQSSAISNTSSSVMEAVSGNYNLGNTSIGNDSLFNSSKFNINEGNRSVDNDSIGNKSLGNFSKDNISEGNKSFNNDSFNNKSFNNVNANKVDTATLERKGFTEKEDGYGKITIDNSTGERTALGIKKVESLVETSKSYTEDNTKGINEAKHFEVGGSVGAGISKSGGKGESEASGKGGIFSLSGSLGGGYNESITKSSTMSSGSHTTDKREEYTHNKEAIQGASSAKEAINMVNNKEMVKEVDRASAPVVKVADSVAEKIANPFALSKEDENIFNETQKEMESSGKEYSVNEFLDTFDKKKAGNK